MGGPGQALSLGNETGENEMQKLGLFLFAALALVPARLALANDASDYEEKAEAKIYRCVAEGRAGFHTHSYFGVDSYSLAIARSTALAACRQNFAFGADRCLLSECISF